MDKSTKIYFENQSIQEAFTKLLVHPCQVCSTNPIFPNLQTLKDHLRKEHEHFFCELCVEHLKVNLEKKMDFKMIKFKQSFISVDFYFRKKGLQSLGTCTSP